MNLWLERLQALTEQLLVASSREDIARVVANAGRELVGARAASVYLREGESLKLIADAGYGDDEVVRFGAIALSAPWPLAAAAVDAQPRFLKAGEGLEAFPDIERLVRACGDHGVAALPLVVAERPFGVVGLSFAKPIEFGERTRHELLTLSSLCAQALDRARLLKAERDAKRFQQRLIGIVSHDLRTPLSAIALASELIAKRGVDDVQGPALTRIRRSTERMHRIVSDLVDYTQAAAAGGLAVQFGQVDLHDICSQVLSAVSAKDRAIVYERGDDGAAVLDRARLEQVVENLVSNALKYGAPGTPITVRWQKRDGAVVLEVHNEGTPIAADAVQELFEPFRRGTREPGRESLGLGLYIVQQIVAAHGGTVEVRSTAAEGTTFRVAIPEHAGTAALAAS